MFRFIPGISSSSPSTWLFLENQWIVVVLAFTGSLCCINECPAESAVKPVTVLLHSSLRLPLVVCALLSHWPHGQSSNAPCPFLMLCIHGLLPSSVADGWNRLSWWCKYPEWDLTRATIKQKKKTSTNQGPDKNTVKTDSNSNPYIVVSYIQGMSESCKNICRKPEVEMYFKGGHTIKGLLVHPKDKDNILQKSGVIYRFRCGRVDCDEEYIGESGRTFVERFRQHMKVTSPIHDHHNITGHELSLDNFNIVGREDQSISRTIKEAILITVNEP